MVELFAIAAASWAVLMAIAPLLQVRRMIQRRSPADVSIGYLLILIPGFALWVAYGIASADMAMPCPLACEACQRTGQRPGRVWCRYWPSPMFTERPPGMSTCSGWSSMSVSARPIACSSVSTVSVRS